jgi:hypothetical protein
MTMSGSTADDIEPSEFLQRIRKLGEERDQQDSERVRKLEEEILQGRSERERRRAGQCPVAWYLKYGTSVVCFRF